MKTKLNVIMLSTLLAIGWGFQATSVQADTSDNYDKENVTKVSNQKLSEQTSSNSINETNASSASPAEAKVTNTPDSTTDNSKVVNSNSTTSAASQTASQSATKTQQSTSNIKATSINQSSQKVIKNSNLPQNSNRVDSSIKITKPNTKAVPKKTTVPSSTNITAGKVSSVNKRVYSIQKNKSVPLYSIKDLKNKRIMMIKTNSVAATEKRSWVVSKKRYIKKQNQVNYLYYFVQDEVSPLSGWMWHGNLVIKPVNQASSVIKIKPKVYFRRNAKGSFYKLMGPNYDTKVSNAHHYLKNYVDTAWTATKKITITDTKGKKHQYLWLTNGKKVTGWIDSKYVDTKVLLKVKPLKQNPEFPTGCEAVATTMMLNHAGSKVTSAQVVDYMPRSTNDGNKGFIGNPRSNTGWWIYPPALMGTVKHFIGKATNMTGASITAIKKKINRGHAVVAWIAGFGGAMTRINHAITLIGYDIKRIFFNDPWSGKRLTMSYGDLEYYRRQDLYRTLSY